MGIGEVEGVVDERPRSLEAYGERCVSQVSRWVMVPGDAGFRHIARQTQARALGANSWF